MPKLKPDTEKIKAQRLTKLYIEKGLNQSEVARAEGVSRVAINQRLKRKPVQDLLQSFLNSPELKQVLIEVAKMGLGAERSTGAAILVQKDGTVVKADDEGGIMIPDHNARHKFWHDLVFGIGALKSSGFSIGVQVFCGSEIVSKIKEIEKSSVKSKVKND